MRIVSMAVLCGAFSFVGCVESHPPVTVASSCGHLIGNPDLYSKCAADVRFGQELRQQAWQDAAARDQPSPSTQATFAEPAIYTIQTQAPASPSPAPIPDPGAAYLPPQPPSPSLTGPNAPAFVGQVPGGPEVYVVPR